MWLLNTHTAELKFFSGPDDIPGGYAILSHVWGNPTRNEKGNLMKKDPDEEDTFQKVQSAFKECQENARSRTSILASAATSDNPPFQTISPLSAQVNDLSIQVRDLTAQFQALVVALQEHDPTLAAVISAHHITTRGRSLIPYSHHLLFSHAPGPPRRPPAGDIQAVLEEFLGLGSVPAPKKYINVPAKTIRDRCAEEPHRGDPRCF